jgi:hypothetical protein
MADLPAQNIAFTTAQLVAVIPTLLTPQTFFLDRYFPNVVMSDSELVAIDVIIGKRRIAPFVSPLVEGKMVEALRTQTNFFKPPYIKDLRAPDLRRPVQRAVGERLMGGGMTPAQRQQANLSFEMEDQLQMIQRRMEWMAIRILLTGSVTVSGDGFPTTTIEFGRDAGQTVVLSGGARWGEAGVSPVANLMTWSTLMLKSAGVAAADVIMDPLAFDLFIQDLRLQPALLYPAWQPYGNQLNPGTQVQKGMVQKGQWGQLSIMVYNDWYVDDNNVEQPMLPPYSVIIASPELEGQRAFGVIIDEDFDYTAMEYAVKTWTEKNPSQRLILMQSAPLPIPGRPNASFAATVR